MEKITKALTISEAGKIYKGTGLTPTAIRRLVKNGELPSRKVGNKYLLTLENIENWIREA